MVSRGWGRGEGVNVLWGRVSVGEHEKVPEMMVVMMGA